MKLSNIPIALLFILFSCETAKNTTGTTPNPNEAGILSDSLDGLMKNIAVHFGQNEMNLTLGVVKDGKVFLTKHYGYSNTVTNTRFSDSSLIYLASISKSFTGTLAVILDKKGILKLNHTLSDYLPGFRFENKELDPSKISLSSLHTHTHRIDDWSVQSFTAYIGHNGIPHITELLKKYSKRLPTDKFTYSNTGPVVYSLLVEKQTGKPWQQVMDEELFKPLGMSSTTSYVSGVNKGLISYAIGAANEAPVAYFLKTDRTMSAAGGHLSTVGDMMKYLAFFMSRGTTVPGILSEKEIRYAISPLVPQTNQYHSFSRYGYGLGWEQSIMNGEHIISRFGTYGSILPHLSFLKDGNIGIIAISNQRGFESLAHLTAAYIYNFLLKKHNRVEFLNENLRTLSNNFENAKKARERIAKAVQNPAPASMLPGNYNGGDESGIIIIKNDHSVIWGDLNGKIYPLTDTSAVIDFGVITRNVLYKKENNKVVGLTSDQRHFKKTD